MAKRSTAPAHTATILKQRDGATWVPRRLVIGGLSYAIRWGSDEELCAALGRKSEAWGVCDTNTQVIWLNKGLAADRIAPTLMHEILHALIDSLGLGVNLLNGSASREELLVHALAPALSELLTLKVGYAHESKRATNRAMRKTRGR